ncbi:hypothetical protein [Actinopolymorpha alba]|uniref:hypothetical protein n=1 Tax=Actinopolymorpha alba TaxID=533267 RepID=UPI00037E2D80|nr:hypothetical protein [Actinopolymorpha alba]
MAHRKLDILERDGFVILKPNERHIAAEEWEALDYLDWKSGGDTNFAVLASADGTDDPRGFWELGKPDKDGIWTDNAEKAPTLRRWVEDSKVRFGRVRVIKLNPSTSENEVTSRFLHQDDNNRLNPDGEGWVVRAWVNLTDDPDSYMVLREDKDDPSTEHRIPLPRNAQFLVDTERLWHAVYHPGPEPRYAMITSFESGPALKKWVTARMPRPRSKKR